MTDDRDNDWGPGERAALDRLARSRDPDPRLKERIRSQLRTRGALVPRHAQRWRLAAAGIALFVAGALTGQMLSRDARPGVVIATDRTLAPAERIQATGSEYVEMIAQLIVHQDSLPAGTAEQGRGATLSTLRGAAEYALRLPGLDHRTAEALAALRGATDE